MKAPNRTVYLSGVECDEFIILTGVAPREDIDAKMLPTITVPGDNGNNLKVLLRPTDDSSIKHAVNPGELAEVTFRIPRSEQRVVEHIDLLSNISTRVDIRGEILGGFDRKVTLLYTNRLLEQLSETYYGIEVNTDRDQVIMLVSDAPKFHDFYLPERYVRFPVSDTEQKIVRVKLLSPLQFQYGFVLDGEHANWLSVTANRPGINLPPNQTSEQITKALDEPLYVGPWILSAEYIDPQNGNRIGEPVMLYRYKNKEEVEDVQ